MESSSFVSKAKTAFHSAAAKAEKVLTDIKADFKSERETGEQSQKTSKKLSEHEQRFIKIEGENHNELKRSKWIPAHQGKKHNWHDWKEQLKNMTKRKTEGDKKKFENLNSAFPAVDGQLLNSEMKGLECGNININAPYMAKIPPASILKQLAVAVEYGKNYKSVKDLALSRDSSPERERASLSFSAVKSLMLREKDEKSNFECGNDDETFLLIQSLFDAEDYFCRWKNASGSATPTVTSLPRYFHTAPPETFVTRLSEVMGRFNTLQKMVSFWCRVVVELRRRWSEGQPVPGMPLDESPDLNSCLLHQQLQVINCCLSRKHHRIIATRSLDSVTRVASPNSEESFVSHDMVSSSPIMYARINSGNLVLRLGADHCSKKNLTLLETGESIFSPVTQEGPVLTEELIRETEEFVMQTGSLGAGCSQLLSDMQAFKAANPGCILEDFVRWYSPADWIETKRSNETKDSFDGGDPSSKRGQLSSRMQKEGNLWHELWKNAKPLPAAKQTPLFDEDLAVEGILNTLEDIQPAVLFKQLFASLLGSGFIIAETTLAKNSNLSKVFYECKDYMIAIFQGDTWTDNIDDLCQVYETVETMLIHPEDSHRIMSEEPIATGEPRRLFKKFNLNFGGKDRREKRSKVWKKSEENPTFQMFSDLFDGKSSLFTKKPHRPSSTSQADVPPYVDENAQIVV